MGLICCVKKKNPNKVDIPHRITPCSDHLSKSLGPSESVVVLEERDNKKSSLKQQKDCVNVASYIIPDSALVNKVGKRLKREDESENESMPREEIDQKYRKCILMNNNSYTESVVNYPYPGVIVRTEMSSGFIENTKYKLPRHENSIEFMMGDDRTFPILSHRCNQ